MVALGKKGIFYENIFCLIMVTMETNINCDCSCLFDLFTLCCWDYSWLGPELR